MGSSSPTSHTSAASIPNKRSSSDFAPVLPTLPKRPRIAPSCSKKENALSALQKGKERERQTPPPSQHRTFNALGSLSKAASSTSAHPQPAQTFRRADVASRPFDYKYKVHTDLQDVIFVL